MQPPVRAWREAENTLRWERHDQPQILVESPYHERPRHSTPARQRQALAVHLEGLSQRDERLAAASAGPAKSPCAILHRGSRAWPGSFAAATLGRLGPRHLGPGRSAGRHNPRCLSRIRRANPAQDRTLAGKFETIRGVALAITEQGLDFSQVDVMEPDAASKPSPASRASAPGPRKSTSCSAPATPTSSRRRPRSAKGGRARLQSSRSPTAQGIDPPGRPMVAASGRRRPDVLALFLGHEKF